MGTRKGGERAEGKGIIGPAPGRAVFMWRGARDTTGETGRSYRLWAGTLGAGKTRLDLKGCDSVWWCELERVI